MRKGLILAGGLGSRFSPATLGVSKHLFPIYDKPMLYYPLTTLMLAGVREIGIIGDDYNLEIYKKILENGQGFGIKLTYIIQKRPKGIPEAFALGKAFLAGSPCALILGDNFFYGSGLLDLLSHANRKEDRSHIFLTKVRDPNRFGIAELDSKKEVISLAEKPTHSSSNMAITGLYFLDKDVPIFSEKLKFSERGELEIIELLKIYLSKKLLDVTIIGRGFMWFDGGTPSSLLRAANFVEAIQFRQGLIIGSPEEVAFSKGWIDKEILLKRAKRQENSLYGKYLYELAYAK